MGYSTVSSGDDGKLHADERGGKEVVFYGKKEMGSSIANEH
jgi:hypothetical protein